MSSSWVPTSAWKVDPDDPRAPPEEIWDALSPADRQRIVECLPSEFPSCEAYPPEGDAHFKAKTGTREVLDGFFARVGRRVYLACELPIYYPGEPLFAPDISAVLDVATHERKSWVVKEEGKGLDLAIEILVSGDRRKDLEENVERYARLGIAEYFVFDRARLRLHGYRLPEVGARAYQPILPQGGLYASHVLGLDLRLEESKLRFFHGAASIPDANELIASLQKMIDGAELRVTVAEERADEERRRRAEVSRLLAEQSLLLAEESRLRAEAERRLADARVEIERLKADRSRS